MQFAGQLIGGELILAPGPGPACPERRVSRDANGRVNHGPFIMKMIFAKRPESVYYGEPAPDSGR